jgi:hypothetical protein
MPGVIRSRGWTPGVAHLALIEHAVVHKRANTAGPTRGENLVSGENLAHIRSHRHRLAVDLDVVPAARRVEEFDEPVGTVEVRAGGEATEAHTAAYEMVGSWRSSGRR